MPFDILAAAEQIAADHADRTDPESPRYRPFVDRILNRSRPASAIDVLTQDERRALAIRALFED